MKVSKEAMVGVYAVVKYWHQVSVRLRRTHLSDDQVRSSLLAGDPALLVFSRDNTVTIDVALLQPDEVIIVARRLREILD